MVNGAAVTDLQHWIAVACSDEEVLMANSLASQAVSPLVARELKQLFAQHVGNMVVKQVRCAQQPNASDCTVKSFPVPNTRNGDTLAASTMEFQKATLLWCFKHRIWWLPKLCWWCYQTPL